MERRRLSEESDLAGAGARTTQAVGTAQAAGPQRDAVQPLADAPGLPEVQQGTVDGPEESAGPIVAVIPAFNEERFIASVVFKARRHAGVVIVVDDGSADATGSLASQAGAHVVALDGNRGKAQALRAGLQQALRLAPRAVVVLDGDAQHDADEIPAVVRPILENRADVVVGSRHLAPARHVPRLRYQGQRLMNWMTARASGLSLTDSQSGYRAFSLEAARLVAPRSHRLGLESEMQFLIKDLGLCVEEVPVSALYPDGEKRSPFAQGVQVAGSILDLLEERRPLAVWLVPALVFMAAGVGFWVRVLAIFRRSGLVALGSVEAGVLCALLGVLFGTTGIILHASSRIVSRLEARIDASIRSALLARRSAPETAGSAAEREARDSEVGRDTEQVPGD